jgi:hypothetical protein
MTKSPALRGFFCFVPVAGSDAPTVLLSANFTVNQTIGDERYPTSTGVEYVERMERYAASKSSPSSGKQRPGTV